MPNVRPGTYMLYTFTDGAAGEFSKPDVTLQAGTTTLGNLTWNIPHKGSRIAWEIGVPDRRRKNSGMATITFTAMYGGISRRSFIEDDSLCRYSKLHNSYVTGMNL
jgi:hypothetical protein